MLAGHNNRCNTGNYAVYLKHVSERESGYILPSLKDKMKIWKDC